MIKFLHKIPPPVVAVAVLLLLGACGYQSVHRANDGIAQDNIQHLRINPIADRPGQILRNALSDRLYINGTKGEAKFAISIDLTFNEETFGIRRSGEASAHRLILRAKAVVTSLDDYQPVHEFRVNKSTHFISEDFSVFAIDRAREETRKALIIAAAEAIRLQLLSKSANW